MDYNKSKGRMHSACATYWHFDCADSYFITFLSPPPQISRKIYATWRRIRPLFMRKTTSIFGRMLKSWVAMITQ